MVADGISISRADPLDADRRAGPAVSKKRAMKGAGSIGRQAGTGGGRAFRREHRTRCRSSVFCGKKSALSSGRAS